MASAVDPAKSAISNGNLQTAILPAVVVPDETLWQMFYDEKGGLQGEPSLVDSTTLFVGHEIELLPRNLWMKLSHVQFFTLSGLNRFLEGLTGTTAFWEEWFPDGTERYEPSVH